MTSLEALLFLCMVAVTAGQVTFDMQTGSAPSNMGPYGLTWVSQPSTTYSAACDKPGVLKVRYELNYRRVGVFDMAFGGEPTGWTFGLGDSATNDGYGGDGGTQSNNAEVHSIGRTIFIYGRNRPDGQNYGLMYAQDNFLGNNVRIELADQRIKATSGLNAIFIENSSLFLLRDQADSRGSINRDLFVSMNRVPDTRSDRRGRGLCKVTFTWIS